MIALVWANVAAESYFRFAQPLRFLVNDVGMAFFFALIAQEIVEAVMPGGALHSWRRWGLGLVAAAGGTIGAAVTYLAYVNIQHETVLSQAWPVACAIDVAVAYYVLKIIAPRSAVLPFVLLLGIATNIFGTFVVAVQDTVDETRAIGTILVVMAIGIAMLLRSWRVPAFWPYIAICGTASWWAFYWLGLHPALAFLPLVPLLPHEPRRMDLFTPPPDDDATHHFEHEWNHLVQVVLFFFGLVNAGVVLRGYDTGTWALLTAALVGRPVGVLAAIAVAVGVGLHLPPGVGWRHLVVAALSTAERVYVRALLRERTAADRGGAGADHDWGRGDECRRHHHVCGRAAPQDWMLSPATGTSESSRPTPDGVLKEIRRGIPTEAGRTSCEGGQANRRPSVRACRHRAEGDWQPGQRRCRAPGEAPREEDPRRPPAGAVRARRHVRAARQAVAPHARLLAPVADGQGVVQALDRLAEKYRDDFAAAALASFRAGLLEREVRADRQAKVQRVLKTVSTILREERTQVKSWQLKRAGFRPVGQALESTCRRARQAMAAAIGTSNRGQLPCVATPCERPLVPGPADRIAVRQPSGGVQTPARGSRRCAGRVSQLRA